MPAAQTSDSFLVPQSMTNPFGTSASNKALLTGLSQDFKVNYPGAPIQSAVEQKIEVPVDLLQNLHTRALNPAEQQMLAKYLKGSSYDLFKDTRFNPERPEESTLTSAAKTNLAALHKLMQPSETPVASDSPKPVSSGTGNPAADTTTTTVKPEAKPSGATAEATPEGVKVFVSNDFIKKPTLIPGEILGQGPVKLSNGGKLFANTAFSGTRKFSESQQVGQLWGYSAENSKTSAKGLTLGSAPADEGAGAKKADDEQKQAKAQEYRNNVAGISQGLAEQLAKTHPNGLDQSMLAGLLGVDASDNFKAMFATVTGGGTKLALKDLPALIDFMNQTRDDSLTLGNQGEVGQRIQSFGDAAKNPEKLSALKEQWAASQAAFGGSDIVVNGGPTSLDRLLAKYNKPAVERIPSGAFFNPDASMPEVKF
ncbi:MAG: hypothetical protein VKJ06_02225 [Vampirovibrionales bacterium]|nr:hypothetical protein [Vampirovibrionales bacterium]